MKKPKSEKTVEVCIVRGVEGLSITINDYRVAGNKAWGGGPIIWKQQVPISEIKKALK